MLDVGQANELKMAFRRANFSNDDIKRLCEGSILVGVRSVLRGYASVAYVIDCDAQPFVPSGWSIEEHQKGGVLTWNKEAQKDALYLSKWQRGNKYTLGDFLRRDLLGKPVLNATVLDYLLVNQRLIPEEWKGRRIFFWGTIYRDSEGYLYVRCLQWCDSSWKRSSLWLINHWDSSCPAAARVA
jgi:hypothetical protein